MQRSRTPRTSTAAPGEWHWHGATDTTVMTHLAIEVIPEDGTPSEFAGPVTAAEPDGATAAPPLVRTVVMDQRLPAPLHADRVEARRITLAPNQATGPHTHNGPVFGSIEAGSALYQVEGGPAVRLTVGDLFYEPEGTRITRFDTESDGVTFLAYFPLRPGEDATMDFLDARPGRQQPAATGSFRRGRRRMGVGGSTRR
jgi:quercetin dioxygenase-like cupin family protein